MTWRAEEESRPEVGSSTSKTPGSWTSSIPIEARRLLLPEISIILERATWPRLRSRMTWRASGGEDGRDRCLLDREVGEEGVVVADMARQAAECGRVGGAAVDVLDDVVTSWLLDLYSFDTELLLQ
ncbi:Alpha-ketoglutarate-dependent 2,4-dichlorophenoxyacetate dioxygenase,4-dichlorophenoxyacetate dioxygenase, partial [Striga asiatica]